MTDEKHTTPESFQAAYQILKQNAQQLENTEQIDIDNLVNLVEESLAAYRVCQTRIDAVERALKEAFENSGVSDDN